MTRFWLSLWIGSWAMGVSIGAYWLLAKAWYLMGHDWVWTGLALVFVSFCLLILGGKLFWITGMVMAGRLNARLAMREFRNALSDAIMFGKTGMTKW